MIKMSIAIIIRLAAIMVLAFNCFQMLLLITKKQCSSLSKKQEFQKKSIKRFTFYSTKLNVKNNNNNKKQQQSFRYRIRKINTSTFFSNNIYKIHK